MNERACCFAGHADIHPNEEFNLKLKNQIINLIENENVTTFYCGGRRTRSRIAFAILIEAIITYFNQFFVNGTLCWKMLVSIALGIIIAVAYKLDLPAHFNLN